jgi:nicotinate-nucleotide pyrophosphorylase (carboxylating)
MSAPELRLPPLLPILYEDVVRRALIEDLGRAGDVTTDAIVPENSLASGRIVARGAGRVAGLDAALAAFRFLDSGVVAEDAVRDGEDAAAGASLARLRGSARALLAAERTALNLLGRLCGIATATRELVAAARHTDAKVVCTRKTTPGLRLLEKYAVRAGGGSNHRFGLDDAVLIKDNHLAVAGSVAEAVRRVRKSVGHMVKIELEVDSLAQLDEALSLGVDAVLLDNFTVDELRRAAAASKGKVILEASGGIRPSTVVAVAETGVDLISVGWITHSSPALDVALDLE